ncbi:MAG: GNAT family N-acetyltransferase [Solirubrobacterales bacterium]
MIRKALFDDLEEIMGIIRATVAEMREYNNTQWDENYPGEKDFINDINNQDLYVAEQNDKLVGFVCINKVEPVEYAGLKWTLKETCMVVHRMAVNINFRREGIGSELMKFAENLALSNNIRYLKTDTYSINTKMNALFKKCGYTFVGKMNFLGKEKPFNCYEKVLNNE